MIFFVDGEIEVEVGRVWRRRVKEGDILAVFIHACSEEEGKY